MSNEYSELRTTAPDGRPDHEQPDWRREFPIDVPQDQYVARRDFTKFMVLTSLAFVVGQLWIALLNWFRGKEESLPVLRIATLEEIPVGGALPFNYPEPDNHCLLLRPDAKTLVAYNQECTHLSCAVIPEMKAGRLHCPCHHGYFDLATGRPLAGPPRRPLLHVVLENRNGVVYAVGIERRTV